MSTTATRPSPFKPHNGVYLTVEQERENAAWRESHRQWNIKNPTPSDVRVYLGLDGSKSHFAGAENPELK